MANGLGQKVSESLDLTGNITSDSPPIFFTWKEGAGLNGDSHTQDGANAVIDKYDDLGISDRVLGYEIDNNDLYQYLPNFTANVLNFVKQLFRISVSLNPCCLTQELTSLIGSVEIEKC